MDKIDELLTRRVDKIYPNKEALEKVLRSGKKLRLYQGFDPSGAQLHLGHTVGIRKLMEFANLGHDVIFLFGDGTVLVGDPSERKKGRKLITEKEIAKNAASWKKQVEPIVDFKKVRILHNKDWLTKLSLKDIIKIGSKISAVQLFKRDNFTRRIKAGNTVWWHETMYPLLQGYDSVHMNVDLEIGGSDQMFNMLVGRELQKKLNNKEKFVLTTKMIVGTDGKKMSKTSRNCIWVTDAPKDMFGKIMSITDGLIGDYFEFFTDIPMEKVEVVRKKVKVGKYNPMNYKKQLAKEITRQFHGKEKADEAEKEFEKVYQGGGVPRNIKNKKLNIKKWNIADLLVKLELAESKSEAKRLIQQGAVKINGKRVLELKSLRILGGEIFRVGKRKWVKIS